MMYILCREERLHARCAAQEGENHDLAAGPGFDFADCDRPSMQRAYHTWIEGTDDVLNCGASLLFLT